MEFDCEAKAGYKHHLSAAYLAHLKQEVMDMCKKEGLHQVDLLTPAERKITEKERLLWEYVLSAYGTEEFTTKQLEKDFRNAAYATIRTFVMKFHEMGLLAARKAGNRVYYKVR